MIPIIVSIIASVISGMVLFFLQRFFKKKYAEDEKREKRRHQKDVLIIKSINAIGALTQANAIALRDGKTNGELKAALKEYDAAKKEMTNFIIHNSVKEVNNHVRNRMCTNYCFDCLRSDGILQNSNR